MEMQREYSGHTMSVTSVASKGSLIASGSRDQTTRLWDLETGKQVGMRKIERNVVTWVGWRDENTMVLASEDLTLRIWDVRTKPFKPQSEVKVGTNFATNADILINEGKIMLATGHRGFNNEGAEVKLWDLTDFSAGTQPLWTYA
jgi:WD40 repeat protein